MTPEQKAAFVMARVAELTASVAAMQAENAMRQHTGGSPAYTEEHFRIAIGEAGISHNQVIEFFREG
jgi:hypothetical protein